MWARLILYSDLIGSQNLLRLARGYHAARQATATTEWLVSRTADDAGRGHTRLLDLGNLLNDNIRLTMVGGKIVHSIK
jgi:hypothetical protein